MKKAAFFHVFSQLPRVMKCHQNNYFTVFFMVFQRDILSNAAVFIKYQKTYFFQVFCSHNKPDSTRQYQTISVNIPLSNFPLPIPQSLEIPTTIQLGHQNQITTQIGYPPHLTTLITFHTIYRISLHNPPPFPTFTTENSTFKNKQYIQYPIFRHNKKTAIFQAVFYTFILNIYIQYIPDVFIRLNIYYLF